jgi:hypothetical protein
MVSDVVRVDGTGTVKKLLEGKPGGGGAYIQVDDVETDLRNMGVKKTANKSSGQNRMGISQEGSQGQTQRKKEDNITANGVHNQTIITDFKTYRTKLYTELQVQVMLYQCVQMWYQFSLFPTEALHFTRILKTEYKNYRLYVLKLLW